MIGLNTSGFAEVSDFIQKLEERHQPTARRALASNLGVIVLSDVAKNFRGEHAPDGSPWAKLSPVTIARRRKGKKGGSPKILRDTAGLMMSVTPGGSEARPVSPTSSSTNPRFESSAEGAVRRADAAGFLIGTNLDRAGKHQFGDAGGQQISERVEAHRRKAHDRVIAGVVFRVKAHHVREHVRQTVTRPIPQREFLGVSAPALDQIAEYAADFSIRVET